MTTPIPAEEARSPFFRVKETDVGVFLKERGDLSAQHAASLAAEFAAYFIPEKAPSPPAQDGVIKERLATKLRELFGDKLNDNRFTSLAAWVNYFDVKADALLSANILPSPGLSDRETRLVEAARRLISVLDSVTRIGPDTRANRLRKALSRYPQPSKEGTP